MSSLVHLGRTAAVRAELATPKEFAAAFGALVPDEESARRRMTAADVMTRFPSTVGQSASMWTAWGKPHGARD